MKIDLAECREIYKEAYDAKTEREFKILSYRIWALFHPKHTMARSTQSRIDKYNYVNNYVYKLDFFENRNTAADIIEKVRPGWFYMVCKRGDDNYHASVTQNVRMQFIDTVPFCFDAGAMILALLWSYLEEGE